MTLDLKVYCGKELIKTLALREKETYFVGRSKGCHVKIKDEGAISRKHFRLVFKDSQWQLELLSEMGGLRLQGNPIENLTLEGGEELTLSSYRFVFSQDPHQESQEHSEKHSQECSEEYPQENLQEHEHSQEHLQETEESPENPQENSGVQGDDEKTQIGKIEFIPYLLIMDNRQKPMEILRLEGGKSWIAGRGKKCHIQIKNPNASREHFKIQKMEDSFYALDLGSVNGTEINGEPLSSEEMHLLKSGDCLTALNYNFRFEVRDGGYNKKMVEVISNTSEEPPVIHQLQPYQNPNPSPNPNHLPHPYGHPQGTQEQQQGGYGENVPAVSGHPPLDSLASENPSSPASSSFPVSVSSSGSSTSSLRARKRKQVLMVCVSVLLIGVVLRSLDEDAGQKQRDSEQNSPLAMESEKSFENLSEDQKDMVQHSYQLAHNFYLQAKYSLALDQLGKIHHLVDNYKTSHQMQEACQQAISISRELEETRRRNEEKEMLKLKVASIITKCRSLVNPQVDMRELEKCLVPAVELDPENREIASLQGQANEYVELQKQKQRQRQVRQKEFRRLEGLLRKAKGLHKRGRFSTSISVYKKVSRSRFPSLEDKAKRGIASVRGDRAEKIRQLRVQSEVTYERKKLNESIVLLQKALRISPQNVQLQAQLKKQSQELKLKMKGYYQEAILEETLGNLAKAKNIWKEIMEEDIRGNTYFNKAKIKLKRYGEL